MTRMRRAAPVLAAVGAALLLLPGTSLANQSNCSYGDPPAPSPRIVHAQLDGLDFNVLLPSDYATSGRRYPVLFLLHGADYNENTWLTQSDIEAFTAPFTDERAAIVVMPDGGPMGFYTDWYQGDEQWETYHLRRLVPYVDAQFRTIADGAHRAVAGFSMGGFGAMRYAARHPELFAAAGSFSGINHQTAPEAPYGGPGPSDRRSGAGSPGPVAAPVPARAYRPPDDAGSGCGQQNGSDFGDRVSDAVIWHGNDPADLAPDFAGVALYVYAGNGTPCGPEDALGPPAALAGIEPAIRSLNETFDGALTAAAVPHTTDFRSCGLHQMQSAQRGLHAFWPVMTRAWGRPPLAWIARYRSIDRDFAVWGWRFRADPKRADEFLEIENAGQRGFTLTGSGTETVVTAPLYKPRARYRIGGALPATARASRSGRLVLRVDLGAPHTQRQFSGGPPAFVERSVTVRRAPAAQPPPARHARRHRHRGGARFTG